MALVQKYGIKYPFSSDNNEELFMDLNETYEDSIKSRVLHVIFTPKGQKLRDPGFGTDLIKFLFEPTDGETINKIKEEITSQIIKFVPNVRFNDISIYDDEKSDNGKIVIVHYTITKGNNNIEQSVGVRI